MARRSFFKIRIGDHCGPGPMANFRALSAGARRRRRVPGTLSRHAENHSPARRRDQGRRAPGEGRRRAARRRRHRALHRPLPQGSHRRPRRHPAARTRSAPVLPARARRPPRGRAQEHRRAGQADARAARRDRRRADQAGAGRPLPALQAEAPHQGPDRARGRHRAAGRQAVRRPDAGPARRGRRPSSSRPTTAWTSRPCTRCSTACATSSPSAGPRTPRWCSALREWLWAEGLLQVQPDGRARTRTTPTSPSSATTSTTTSRSAACPRTARWRCSAAARWRSSTPSWCCRWSPSRASPRIAEGKIALHLGWSHAGRAADDLIRKCVAWTWRVKLSLSPRARPVHAPARRGREGRDQGLRRQPARPAAGRAGRPARGDGPGPGHPHRRARWRWSMPPASWSRPHTVYPHEPRKDWEGSLHTLGKLVREARREPDRDRQRHREPRDRQAGRRPDQALPR